jgi:hypothetical protein
VRYRGSNDSRIGRRATARAAAIDADTILIINGDTLADVAGAVLARGASRGLR